ncbi:MAG: phage tail protein [Bacteroidales bacterium]|nr:phage tail protein [Bacteroidales bacterium]
MGHNPLLNNHFQVEWGGNRLGFTEVTGLDMEINIVDFREGNSTETRFRRLPGLEKPGTVTLKRGILPGDNQFYEWMQTIRFNQAERRDVVITLLNESHEPVMRWKLLKAWPSKLSGPWLKSDGNEVAIETLELAHEGMVVETI